MTPEQAKIAIEFLSRADLKGKEAPIFMEIITALQQLSQEKPDNIEPVVK